MDDRQLRRIEQYGGALDFFQRTPITPEPPLLAGKRQQLRTTLERISAFRHVQEVAGIHEVGKLDARRRELRERRMLPLRHIAKGELLFAPGAEAALRVPHARASARVVAAAAVRMADALMPHARVLRAAGVSKDFLVQMRQEARSLALTLKQNAEQRRKGTEATAAIAAEIRKGQSILAVLDGLVLLHCPEKVEQWRILRGSKKKIGRPRKIRPRKKKPGPPPS